MTAEFFAVAWLLKVCVGAKCGERPAPNLYLCQERARVVLELARKDRKLTAECVVVRGEKAGA